MSVRRVAFPVVVSLLALLLAVPASAFTWIRHDPDDFEVAPDVHRTAKRVFQASDGSWRFRISASGDTGPDYRLKVLLDTRGGPRAEFAMVATVSGLELVSCDVHRIGGGSIDANCDADAFRAWWGVARRDLDHSKVIRWRIVARETPEFGGAVTDLAPNGGWYR
ncbi:MAG TPA: hypothetical protein VFZ75_06240 [Actinomycetota bacterium]|nr:hypothetical protein [Actinomycetota bacterium]